MHTYPRYQQISKLKADNPFIGKVMDGNGSISLSTKKHEVLTEYFRLRLRFRRALCHKKLSELGKSVPICVVKTALVELYFVSEKGRSIVI